MTDLTAVQQGLLKELLEAGADPSDVEAVKCAFQRILLDTTAAAEALQAVETEESPTPVSCSAFAYAMFDVFLGSLVLLGMVDVQLDATLKEAAKMYRSQEHA